MRFSVLGPIEVETADGERHSIGSANQRAIIAMLLSRPGTTVATDELIDGLWGDDPPPSAVRSLRTYISRMRRLVGDRLIGHDDGYSLDCSSDELDARNFEDDVAHGRYSEALARWRGRPYGDAGDLPIVRGDALRLETLAAAARSGRLEELLALGKLADAVSGAEAVVLDDPVDETAWATLVRALARSGRVADSLRAYRRAAGHLAEAGLEPSSVLRAAESEALSDPPVQARPRRRVPTGPLTALVGREAELDRLIGLTAQHRLVTIVGPGGVGKTSLSLEVGRSTADRHALGTRIVELSRISEAQAIGPTIRRALDLDERGSGLTDGLGGVDAFVVLDNCEHVIDAVAAEIPELLAGGERLHILATSREPLGVPGEQRWALAPLSTVGAQAPAVALFVERANDVGVEVDPADPRAQAIVAHLDGLPLAVEMAAVRLATTGLADLADELERTVAALVTGHRGAEERHGTLRAVLAWSEALLTPDQRTILADFSIFAGPVGAGDLFAAVDAADPTGAVCALADRSLITVETTADLRARYGSLETVRRFGRERLRAEGRLDAVGRRHARWFTQAAEEAAAIYDSADQADAVDRIDAMLHELRAAHRWSRAHEPSLAMRLSHALFQPAFQGLHLEVFDWSMALAETIGSDDEGSAELYGELSMGLTLLGRIEEATRWAERAIGASDDPVRCRAAYGTLGDIALYAGDLEASVDWARRYDAMAEQAGGRIERAYGKASLALPLAYLGRRDEALALIPAAPPAGAPPTAHGWLSYSRGEVLLDIDSPAALRELDTAIALAESVYSHFLSGIAQVSAASLRTRTGDAEHAIDPLIRTIERLADRGNTTHLLTTLRNLPTLLIRLDEWLAAAEIIGGLSAISISPTFGEEAQRLAAAERAARSALGDEGFALSHRRGAERDLQQTAHFAVTILGGLVPRSE